MKSIVVALALQCVVAEDLDETTCLLQVRPEVVQGIHPHEHQNVALFDAQAKDDCEILNSNLENLGNVQCFTVVKSKCRGNRAQCSERRNERFLDKLLQTDTSVGLLETDAAETSNRRAVYFACTSRDVGGDREAAACTQYEVTREEDCQTSAVQCPIMIAGRDIPAEVSCFRRCGNPRVGRTALLDIQVEGDCELENSNLEGLGNVQCFTVVKSKCRGNRAQCSERRNERFLDNLLQTDTSVDLLETDAAETLNSRAVYFACTSRDVGGDREAAACTQYEVTREEDCQTSAVRCPIMIAGRTIPAEVSCFRRCGNHQVRPEVVQGIQPHEQQHVALFDAQAEWNAKGMNGVGDCEIHSNLEGLGNVQCFTTVNEKLDCTGLTRNECKELSRSNHRFADPTLLQMDSVDLLETDAAETLNRRAVYFACTSRDVGGDREAVACTQYEVTREEDCQTSAVRCPIMIAGRTIPAEVSCFRRCGNHHVRSTALLHTQVKDGNSTDGD